MISAIVLAAGISKRMGKLKQLLAFGKSTILEETLKNLLNSKVDEVVVVLGFQSEKIAQKIITLPVKQIKNPHYLRGMSSSIRWGLTAINKKTDAILIALGDQPLILPDIFNKLIDEHCRNHAGITIPVYKGRRGHPLIFDIKFKEDFLELAGDIGGRDITSKYPDDILEVEIHSDSVIKDIDDRESYQKHLKSYGYDSS